MPPKSLVSITGQRSLGYADDLVVFCGNQSLANQALKMMRTPQRPVAASHQTKVEGEDQSVDATFEWNFDVGDSASFEANSARHI